MKKASKNCPARRLDLSNPTFQRAIIIAAATSVIAQAGAALVIVGAIFLELL